MSEKTKLRICIFLALFSLFLYILIPTGTWADLYLWTDPNGTRHYSNIAPPLKGEIILLEETIQNLPQGTLFKVTRVFDGDTIEAKGEGLTFKIRLAGIDTPEKGRKGQPGQPFAQKARQTLTALIGGKDIRIKQFGIGGYNRMLAEIFVQEQNINIAMLEKGMAEVYRGKRPDTLDTDAYNRAQSKAKSKRIGIWSLGKRYQSPKQWRKENPWK